MKAYVQDRYVRATAVECADLMLTPYASSK